MSPRFGLSTRVVGEDISGGGAGEALRREDSDKEVQLLMPETAGSAICMKGRTRL